MTIDIEACRQEALAAGALPLDGDEARSYLRGVEHIYTDLDGTLFARGGILLANAAGEPCADGAVAVARVQAAGIDVIADTGRSGQVSMEIMRMLNLQTFIGEMGAELREGWLFDGDHPVAYCLGEWDFDAASAGMSPLDAIKASGVVEALFAAWPEMLAWHTPFSIDRTVVALLCGYIDDLTQAQAILDSFPIPLDIIDNGRSASANIVLEKCPEMRSYHIVPRGTSKGRALSEHAASRGWDTQTTCLAIGDAPADVRMGLHCGAVVIPASSAASPLVMDAIQALVSQGRRVFVGTAHGCDIWPEMASLLLGSRSAE